MAIVRMDLTTMEIRAAKVCRVLFTLGWLDPKAIATSPILETNSWKVLEWQCLYQQETKCEFSFEYVVHKILEYLMFDSKSIFSH